MRAVRRLGPVGVCQRITRRRVPDAGGRTRVSMPDRHQSKPDRHFIYHFQSIKRACAARLERVEPPPRRGGASARTPARRAPEGTRQPRGHAGRCRVSGSAWTGGGLRLASWKTHQRLSLCDKHPYPRAVTNYRTRPNRDERSSDAQAELLWLSGIEVAHANTGTCGVVRSVTLGAAHPPRDDLRPSPM